MLHLVNCYNIHCFETEHLFNILLISGSLPLLAASVFTAVHVTHSFYVNLMSCLDILRPTGYFLHQQVFNIQKL